jgi:4-alpha-glucanotransferase
VSDKSVQFCFGIHNHQPVGNFGWVMQDSTEKSYLPFLDVLAEFPSVRVAIHTSGPLIEWMEHNHRKYIDKLAALVDRGQVEILGGGFYEPILTMIPPEDAIEQLARMRTWAKKNLGANVRGIWLTERIWDPSLPLILHEAGVEFTICDTTHFEWAGLSKEAIKGYFITEKHGRTVAVFPIDRKLRYTIPFHDVGETIDQLVQAAENDPGKIITYADDGEKFGVWPGTYDLVYERKWLRNFFMELEKNADRIRMVHFAEAMDQNPPEGRVMLPVASYMEMTEWALPAKAGADLKSLAEQLKSHGDWTRFEPFLRGGFWDNFLVKYPESNRIQKRMLRVSEKVRSIPDDQSKLKNRAQLDLFRGQCNCAYWHGLFGGLYLNYLRDALTRHLLLAEQAADEALTPEGPLSAEVVDFDADGRNEVVLQSPFFNVVASPGFGMALSIVDLREQAFAISNVLTRRPEAYHDAVRSLPKGNGADEPVSIHDIVAAKEEGLADKLVYDNWDRLSFQDHFLSANANLDSFSQQVDLGPNDFIAGAFELLESGTKGPVAFASARHEGLVDTENFPVRINMTKTVELHKDRPELSMTYLFRSLDQPVRLRWACESNLTLLAAEAPDRLLIANGIEGPINQTAVHPAARSFTLKDGWQSFSLTAEMDTASELWSFPIETVSQSESGYERTYQGTSLTFVTDLEVGTDEPTKVTVTWTLRSEDEQ